MFSIRQKKADLMEFFSKAGGNEAIKHFDFIYKITDEPYRFNPPLKDESSFAILSIETTGLTPSDELIEFGITICSYSPTEMKINRIAESHRFYEEPSIPIHPEAYKRHNLSISNLEGMKFSDELIKKIISECDFIVAHNPRFSRKFIDKRFPFLNDFSFKWASLISDIDWHSKGCPYKNLSDITIHYGFKFEQPNTTASNAAIAVLLAEETIAFQEIITALGKLTYRVYAFHAPYEVKNSLSYRGFEWDPNGGVWFKDMNDFDKDSELSFLYDLYFGAGDSVSIKVIDAENRFKS